MESIPEDQRIAVVVNRNRDGKTALHSALIYCHARHEDEGVINSMRALLDAIPVKHMAAAVMAEDCNRNTVWHEAKKHGLVRVIKLLAEFYPQQQAPVQVEEEKERPSVKRSRDGGDENPSAPKRQREERQEIVEKQKSQAPEEKHQKSGWGCSLM
jgi:hypothetical protein